MRRTATRLSILIALLVVALMLGACSGASIEFRESDREYTSSQTRLVLERTDTAQLSDQPSTRAPALRRSALANLRSQGEVEGEAADLITDTLPPESRSVPVYVERATVDGRKSFIIIEAWGSADGNLDRKRLWVLEAGTGDVVYSAAAE